MRCDLHLHSRFSGPVELPGLGRFAHESYSEPRAVYEAARRRGMDLVTLTDHDTVEGAQALEIASLPGTFLSEEVSCTLAGGRRLHVGVFGLDERQHARIGRLRDDAEALFAYLDEQGLPACLNHPFSALTGRRETSDLHLALSILPLVEARNGMMSDALNAHAAAAARAARVGMVGGSDAHTLPSVARAFTMVPAARTREEFLQGLRRGLTVPAGASGGYRRLTTDLARIMAAAYLAGACRAREDVRALGRFALMLAVLPVAAPFLPVATGLFFAHEQRFARRHRRGYDALKPPARRPAAASGPSAAPSPAR